MRQLGTTRLLVLAVFGAGLVTLTGCAANAGPEAAVAEAARAESDASEPERVTRRFMLALARGDRGGMLAHMKPNADVDVILRMRKPGGEPELVELFRTLPITRLRPGDHLADPFVPGQQIIPESIDEDHVVLAMRAKGGRNAWTFFLVRSAGGWQVDMDWFIEFLKRPGSRPRIVPGSPPRVVVIRGAFRGTVAAAVAE
jgi:hypothetical protein